MACDDWKERLLEKACDEIDPAEAFRLDAHLGDCSSCREDLARLSGARAILRDGEPNLAYAPRVVVLEPRPERRLSLAFAAGIACGAIAVAAAFWAGRSATSRPIAEPPVADSAEIVRKADLAAILDRERKQADDRLAHALARGTVARPATAALTREDLDAALGRFERRMRTERATDVDWLLREIEASEYRTGARIGQTREALRYVALASNPGLNAE